MAQVELDTHTLSDEEKTFAEATKRFAVDVVRPASIELDKLSPEEVIAGGSVLWDVFHEYRKMGYHRTGFREELGGLAFGQTAGYLTSELMGQASVGLTISLGVSSLPFFFASMSPEPEMQKLVKDYCADEKADIIGCWAITEPDHGSDWLIDPNTEDTEPKVAPSVRAVLDGDAYVVNGQKAAWVSNGTIATHAALFVTLDPSQGLRDSGILIAPLDLPGVTRGKPLEKMGQRDLNQGEIFFEDVRIPKSHMVCAEPGLYKVMSDRNLAGANASMGSLFTGVAQAAYDEAEAYARVRIQGGKPIIEHQNIKLKLFNMFTQLEAARSLSRRASKYNRLAATPALHYSIASKNFCTETAFKVASEAIQIFGGVGLTKEYPIEKIFRDARAGMIEDGVNETLALGGADWLFA